MPPKTKFSREDIVNAAFELTREKGIEKNHRTRHS